MTFRRPEILSFALILLILAVFAQVRHFDFQLVDDKPYVWDNPHIQRGLTWEGLRWAFSADLIHSDENADYWQPLTFVSRMLDIEFFGMNPGAHHIMNVWFHMLNAILLFSLFRTATGSVAKSFLVAALFSVHPVQVEAVAWITARKDVLSTFFGLLTLRIYIDYVRKHSVKHYLLMLLFLLFGIMSKPTMLIIPFIMLLMDVWPLKRFRLRAGEASNVRRCVFEKFPLFAISFFSCAVTLAERKHALSYTSLAHVLSNAAVNYVHYLRLIFIPLQLHLPSPQPLYVQSGWHVAGATIALCVTSFYAVKASRSRPYLTIAWLWLTSGLMLVVGLAAYQERFLYFPIIGMIIGVVWGISEFMAARSVRLPFRMALGATLVLVLAVRSHAQVRHWQDGFTLFGHALRIDDNNYLARINFGKYLYDQERISFVLANTRTTDIWGDKDIHVEGETASAYLNAGFTLDELGRYDEAIASYKRALAINPYLYQVYNNWGIALGKQKKFEQAMEKFTEALALAPDDIDTHLNFALALEQLDRLDEAAEHYRTVLDRQPENIKALTNLGYILMNDKKIPEAKTLFLKALEINPYYGAAQYNLGLIQNYEAHTPTER